MELSEMEYTKQTNSSNTTSNNKRIFYESLFEKLDKIIKEIKNQLSKEKIENSTLVNERTKLVNCKNKISEALNILLSLENIENNISTSKKKELVSNFRLRYKEFEEVKNLVKIYHENLNKHFLTEDDFLNKNKSKKYTYLNDINNNDYYEPANNDNEDEIQEFKENDLTEHLLLEETKKNFQLAAQNLVDVNTELNTQHNKLSNMNEDLYVSHKYVKQSKTSINYISNQKFYTKLILHSAVILLFIA